MKLNNIVVEDKPRCQIEPHVDPAVLQKELEGLDASVLYRESGYTCYLNRYDEIPNIIREIGVCREETFRNNGEGTGKAIDLDEFDEYYVHMHLWNDENHELVGAYRIGLGREIMRDKGIRGFYSDLFFHFKDSFAPILEESIELGRSFIVNKYQVVPNALKMLLNYGIGRLPEFFPEAKHFFGPASFSSDIPVQYGSLMVEYLKRTRFDAELCDKVVPDIPFVPDFQGIDVESLGLENLSIDQFDRLIRSLSDGKYRVPTLVRAYIKHNCRFLGFNVDPDFNYCIDGFVISDLNF